MIEVVGSYLPNQNIVNSVLGVHPGKKKSQLVTYITDKIILLL